MRKPYCKAVLFLLLLSLLLSIISSVNAENVDFPSVFTKKAESITGCTTVDEWLSSTTAPAYLVTGIMLDYTGAVAMSSPDSESNTDRFRLSSENGIYIGRYADEYGDTINVAGINATKTHCVVFFYVPGYDRIGFTTFRIDSGITGKELDVIFPLGYSIINKEGVAKAMEDMLIKDE